MDEMPLESKAPRQARVMPVVVASVLIAALLTGGGVYAYQNSQAKKTQDDLQSQIDTLKDELASAKRSVSTPAPTPASTPASSVSPGASPALTPSVTPDATTGWKTYASKAFPITLKHPATWEPDASENGSICLYDTEHVQMLSGVKTCNIIISIEKDTFDSNIQKYSTSTHAPIFASPQALTALIGGKTAYGEKGADSNGQVPVHQAVFAGGYVFDFNLNDTAASAVFKSLLTTVTFR